MFFFVEFRIFKSQEFTWLISHTCWLWHGLFWTEIADHAFRQFWGFFFPTEKIANKIRGCCCTGASVPFLSEIHIDRLYNQTLNALFSISQPRLNSAMCPVHWFVHYVLPFIFVFRFLCIVLTLKPLHPIFLLSFFFLDKVHRYMRWLWYRGDHMVGLLEINSRISVLLVLNEYFGLCFLFLTNPFATLISTIPWWVTKLSTNNITSLSQGNWSCWRTALPPQIEIVDAAVVFNNFFFGSFFNKITEDRLLSIFHLKKLRNIIAQVKCKKTRVL